ncbi:hypothetical protein [Stigmatella hybrida]|uniref:hypothetical protein n=1 Tax=Stigmatella hybrida TaxID=394097 RepID=UPI001CDB01FD|nr:hypothetical protein [Stigmatella hybrida]
MTKQLEDFDFEATCRAVAEVAQHASPDAQAALELTTYALHFLYSTDQFAAFREYLRDVKAPAHRPAHAEQDFSSMGQALDWLSQSSPAPGAQIEVSGKRYAVWKDASGKPQLIPSPSAKELEEPVRPSDV